MPRDRCEISSRTRSSSRLVRARARRSPRASSMASRARSTASQIPPSACSPRAGSWSCSTQAVCSASRCPARLPLSTVDTYRAPAPPAVRCRTSCRSGRDTSRGGPCSRASPRASRRDRAFRSSRGRARPRPTADRGRCSWETFGGRRRVADPAGNCRAGGCCPPPSRRFRSSARSGGRSAAETLLRRGLSPGASRVARRQADGARHGGRRRHSRRNGAARSNASGRQIATAAARREADAESGRHPPVEAGELQIQAALRLRGGHPFEQAPPPISRTIVRTIASVITYAW